MEFQKTMKENPPSFIYLFIYCGSPKGPFEITFATFLILRSVSIFRNFPFIFSALPLDGSQTKR